MVGSLLRSLLGSLWRSLLGSLWRSLLGSLWPGQVDTFADGVAVKTTGEETLRLCRDLVDDVVLCDTDEICVAIKDIFEDTRSITEPSGALAVVRSTRALFCCVLCFGCGALHVLCFRCVCGVPSACVRACVCDILLRARCVCVVSKVCVCVCVLCLCLCLCVSCRYTHVW